MDKALFAKVPIITPAIGRILPDQPTYELRQFNVVGSRRFDPTRRISTHYGLLLRDTQQNTLRDLAHLDCLRSNGSGSVSIAHETHNLIAAPNRRCRSGTVVQPRAHDS